MDPTPAPGAGVGGLNLNSIFFRNFLVLLFAKGDSFRMA